MRRPSRLLPLVLLAACTRAPAALEANGTVEVRQADVGALGVARVVSVRVAEGDTVRAGDTLAVLAQSAARPNFEAALARVRTAEARLRDLRKGARPEELSRAEAELAAAEAEARRAAQEVARLRPLAERQVVPRQQLDNAVGAADAAAGRARSASEALALLRAGARPEQVAAAEAEVRNARAAVAMMQGAEADLVLRSPVDGVVLLRSAEPGDVLAVGASAVTVGEVRAPWVRVFVPASAVPALRVGDSVDVTVPGAAGRWRGRIRSVDARAEFTPRAALTEQERADLLFGVRVDVADPSGTLRPGLPVTVRLPLVRAAS